MKFLTRATTTEGFVDLHNHTDRGYCEFEHGVQVTPLQLLEEMYEYSEKYNKPITFSITDHNNTEANNEIMTVIAQNPEKYKNINYIPGVEYSCSADSLGVCYGKNRSGEVVEKPIIKGNRIHMLAYGMDSNDPDIVYLNTLMNDSHDYQVDLFDAFNQRNE